MFEAAVLSSEAMRQAARAEPGMLRPALSGCPSCRTIQMIAAPALGVCPECGDGLAVLDRTDRVEASGQPHPAAA